MANILFPLILLFWKVKLKSKPERLARRINISEESVSRIQLTERVWSRTAERYFRKVEYLCIGVTKISKMKKILSEWIKSNIPILEE